MIGNNGGCELEDSFFLDTIPLDLNAHQQHLLQHSGDDHIDDSLPASMQRVQSRRALNEIMLEWSAQQPTHCTEKGNSVHSNDAQSLHLTIGEQLVSVLESRNNLENEHDDSLEIPDFSSPN